GSTLRRRISRSLREHASGARSGPTTAVRRGSRLEPEPPFGDRGGYGSQWRLGGGGGARRETSGPGLVGAIDRAGWFPGGPSAISGMAATRHRTTVREAAGARRGAGHW